MCHTTTGSASTGRCVSSACSASGACSANTSDFCCDSACTPGNCCGDADCAANPAFGPIYRCVNHACTGCAAVTGNKFFVDPVNGNDGTATGSGIAAGIATPSCSFKTVTRALQAVGGFAVPGTQIVIVGTHGQTTTLAATEALPIVVPANVTVATSDGPIRLNLPASADPTFGNVAGVQLAGHLAVWLHGNRPALLFAAALSTAALVPVWKLKSAPTPERGSRIYPRSRFLARFLAPFAIWHLATGAFNPFGNVYFSKLGFPVQHRGQSLATFRLLFNALLTTR